MSPTLCVPAWEDVVKTFTAVIEGGGGGLLAGSWVCPGSFNLASGDLLMSFCGSQGYQSNHMDHSFV